MGTIRTEISAYDGHQYVVSIFTDERGADQVCVSDQEAGDVIIPLPVFRQMARIVDVFV